MKKTAKSSTKERATTDTKFPFPFFGHYPPAPGSDGHVWGIQFAKAPTTELRAEIAALLVPSLSQGILRQSDREPWLWDGDWLIASAVDVEGAPDMGSPERHVALESLESALRAVHARAKVAVVVTPELTSPTGTDWDAWSRKASPLPKVTSTRWTKGKADPEVERLRLAEASTPSAAGPIALLDVPKGQAPTTKPIPAFVEHVARLDKVQKRPDWVICAAETHLGPVMWVFEVGRRTSRLLVAQGDGVLSMPGPPRSFAADGRGWFDVSDDGAFVFADHEEKRVHELHPRTGARRVLWETDFDTIGPWEAVHLADHRIALSTSRGIYLLVREGERAVAIAFRELSGLKEICATPDRRGLVCCRTTPDPALFFVAVEGDSLQVVGELAGALRDPQLHQGKILVRQGRGFREVRVGTTSHPTDVRPELRELATARLGAGKPALVPLDAPIWPEFPRTVDGERRLASLEVGTFGVHLVDGPTANLLVVTRGARGEAVQRLELPAECRASHLDPSPDGASVLVYGSAGKACVLRLALPACTLAPFPMFQRTMNQAIYHLEEGKVVVVMANDIEVWSSTGKRLSKVSVPDWGYPLEHAITPSRKILMRTADGGVVLLHVSPDGQPTTEHLGCSFAAIFASGGRLIAIRDGVFCELREPA